MKSRAAYQRRWRKLNPGKAKANHLRAGRVYRGRAIDILGGACWCGVDDQTMLDIDHINGRSLPANVRLSTTDREVLTLYEKFGPVEIRRIFQLLCVWHHREKTNQERYRHSG